MTRGTRVPARPRLHITYPGTAGRGLRHVVESGASHTLCGRDPAYWFLEWRTFDSKTIGCKQCRVRMRRPTNG